MYLQTDVLLLASVFEKFRQSCMTIYGLDPAHYYTTPGFSWDAMLKYTKVEIELLTDVDMLLFVERGMIIDLLDKKVLECFTFIHKFIYF